ncbi:hypothetical protein PR048_002160 [Dryococelus australis]|uniref:Uncharacterized protein n=1 Tax=Dryococelus australis TaxID=614101 RepID=A0ABQ9IKS8_9NEOP|nr:hypothetical protein PR048_002160 [Dryococelus australis]
MRYPKRPSTNQTIGHGPDISVPKPPEDFDEVILDMSSDAQSDADEQADNEFECTGNLEPKCFLKPS